MKAFSDSTINEMESKIYYDKVYKTGDFVIDENGNKTIEILKYGNPRVGTSKPSYYPNYSLFQAPASGNIAYLDTSAGEGEVYTDQRYALFRVKL